MLIIKLYCPCLIVYNALKETQPVCELLQNSLSKLVPLPPAVLAAEVFKKQVKKKNQTVQVLYFSPLSQNQRCYHYHLLSSLKSKTKPNQTKIKNPTLSKVESTSASKLHRGYNPPKMYLKGKLENLLIFITSITSTPFAVTVYHLGSVLEVYYLKFHTLSLCRKF